jgi:hypothetical protein
MCNILNKTVGLLNVCDVQAAYNLGVIVAIVPMAANRKASLTIESGVLNERFVESAEVDRFASIRWVGAREAKTQVL